ncbi:P protein [Battus philenor]|uniref:P protein n=1 Tax=Battus philenor TaxID=42288 RepID=UPI0035CF88B8
MLDGPFLPEHIQTHAKSSDTLKGNKLEVWLECLTLRAGSKASKKWTILLQPDQTMEIANGERRVHTLTLPSTTSSSAPNSYAIRMSTNSKRPVPLAMRYTVDPVGIGTGVIYSCLLLCGLYTLIIFEIINRTMAAIIVATTSLAVLALVGERPSLPELVSWLDAETLLLLFSMMVLVAIASETGVFDFLAVFTFQVTRGSLWPMLSLLCILTGLLSTFLDNVTTVMLMTPVTIRLCIVMNLHPIPILTSMVLYSNIGGTATPVGDPPNVIIASNKAVVQSGINFTNFTFHMTPGILLVCVQTYFQLRYIYQDTSRLLLNVPRDIQDLRHQISVLRRTMERVTLSSTNKEHQVTREKMEGNLAELNAKLTAKEKESIKTEFPEEIFQSTLVELKNKYKIHDIALFVKACVAVGFVVLVFFLHSFPELNRVSLGWTALLGAILLLTLIDRQDIEPILHRVEWSTLLFFASLFVLMEALSKLGFIDFIGTHTEALIMWVRESARPAVALLLILWVSGVTSAFVDNIPLTTMMVRVVTTLASNSQLGLPMAPLIWALSFGACLGGNGTLIGASANVVCAGVAEEHGYRFTFMKFFRVGFPVMIGHLVTISFYLLICHYILHWH